MDCTPNALIALAQCNQCASGELGEASIYLLCQWAKKDETLLGAPDQNEVFGDPATGDAFGEP